MKKREADYTLLAKALRFLSIDMVEKAQSGHPGLPMGMADVATVLFHDFLIFNPLDPKWPNRDRFVLSAGHGSALLYSLLYLTGYKDCSLEDLRNFRQLHSKTAGHPEYGLLSGIETTTGPLGQGLATAVGIALNTKLLQARLGETLINHKTYVMVSDGDLMEGISQESISLAGHLQLENLIILYDDNKISIDGPTSLSFSDDTKSRFEACGFDVFLTDGHNYREISGALHQANHSLKPSLIICRTTIGKGAPNKEGTASIHGSPLGENEMAKTRTALEWPYDPFYIPDDIHSAWLKASKRRNILYEEWQNHYKNLEEEEKSFLSGATQEDQFSIFSTLKKKLLEEKNPQATRKSSEMVISQIISNFPNLIGGSADLTPSNNTKTPLHKPISKDDFSGNYIHYGVREHAMAAIMNGLSLQGSFIPYGGTFLVFSDYLKPALRLSALMKQGVIYILTHDSIGLGEDGPTHQPIEHLSSLRTIPNVLVFRPADSVETVECWELALKERTSPSILALSRQNLPLVRLDSEENQSSKGGYCLRGDLENRSLTLIATGSEICLAVEVYNLLKKEGIKSVVLSMPCIERFEQQPPFYKTSLLGEAPRLIIEASHPNGWYRYLREGDYFIGINTFGESAPAKELYNYFGIDTQTIFDKAMGMVKKGLNK